MMALGAVGGAVAIDCEQTTIIMSSLEQETRLELSILSVYTL
jgi:hypothetical protein